MLELHRIPELQKVPGSLHMAVGVFDGIHLGHRAVIDCALTRARRSGGTSVVITFHPHPLRVLRPEAAPRLLTSTPHKVRILRDLGVEALLVVPFDRSFASTPPEDFVYDLHRAAEGRLQSICVGYEWAFGKDRRGNVDLLSSLGESLGFVVDGIPSVECEGQPVSSTRIRHLVETGDMEGASRLLGRRFTILGTVVEGRHLGSRIGFPTANLSTHNEQFPPDGVYAVEVLYQGRRRPGVANIGRRPTVNEPGAERLLELHLFDLDENLYGQELEVDFHGRIRDEKKFDGLEELQAQIRRDVAEARAMLEPIRAGRRNYQ